MPLDQWDDRPDYVPSWWTSGRLNRWVAEKPSRTLVFWLLAVMLSVGLIVWAATDPSGYFDGVLSLSGLVASVFFLLISFRYVPRIVRAMR